MAFQKTYGSISFDKPANQWIIHEAAPHVCIKIKRIFEKIDETDVLPFKFTNTPENAADLIWFLERYPMVISDQDTSRLKRGRTKHTSYINELEKIMLPDYQPTVSFGLNEPWKARAYQITGCEMHIQVKRLLCGDDLGLGKTMIGLLSCLQPGTLPAAMVVQGHLQGQWGREISKYTQLRHHIINSTSPYSLPPADVYIFKYSQLAGWVDIFQTRMFKYAAFDEIQELRRSESNKYSGATVLAAHVDYVLGLSATPMFNYGDEIFNIYQIIKPGCLGTFQEFLREWCAINNKKVIIRNPNALGTYLRDNFLFLRRTRKDVGMELTPVNTIIHRVDYDTKGLKEMEAIAKVLARRIVESSWVERGKASMQLDMLLRQSTGVAKAKYVAAYVKVLLDNGAPVVLGGWHRQVYKIWAEELKEYNPVFYTGTESTKKKNESFRKFTKGETNLFIISLRSGVGLDGLQYRGNDVVIGELDWTPKVHDQLIGRVDRPGQDEEVSAHYLICNFGSDEDIVSLLGLKASMAHALVDPDVELLTKHSDESRIKKFVEKYYEKDSPETDVKIKKSYCCDAIVINSNFCPACDKECRVY